MPRRAVALDPKLQSAQLALVHALADAGRADEAEQSCSPSCAPIPRASGWRRPRSASRGKLEEAEGLYREILQHDPKHVEALRLLAQIAMQSEHYGQAEQLLKRAVEVAPDYLAAWIDLSRAQLERLDLEAARASIERAAADESGLRIRAASRGQRACASRAATRKPSPPTGARLCSIPRPAPWVGLGNTLKTIGRQGEAIAAYRRAAVLPGQSEAWWSLSNLKTFRFTDREVEAIQGQLAARTWPRKQRAQFTFALAKALEDRGEYARAFELYAEGNRLRRTLERYDPVQTELVNERIRAVFDADFLAVMRAPATRTRRRSSWSACRAPAPR